MGFISGIFKKSSVNDFLEQKISETDIEDVVKAINSEEASKKLALNIAISYISNAISQCEFKVYENNKKTINNLYYLLNVQPNKNQNASQFKAKLVNKLLSDGESLVIEKSDNLYVADSFQRNENGFKEDTFSGVVVDNDSILNELKANKVFYFKLNNENITSLIADWNKSFGELLEYAVEKFKDNNSKKYKLDMQTMSAGDPKFKEEYEKVIKKQLKSFIESRTAIYPQFKGYNLEEFTSNSAGGISDVTGLRKEIFDTVSQAFKVPSQMMLGNVSNLNDVVNVFLTFAVDPLAKMIGEEFTRKTSTFSTWKNGCKVRVDTTTIAHIDIFHNASDIDKLISSGFNSVDEVREMTGQDTINTDFATTHWITKNYAPIDQVLNGETENNN